MPKNVHEDNIQSMNQTKTCQISGQTFTFTDEDKKICEKFGIPEPTITPDERHRKRTAFRNELNFYKRKCDKTSKEIIASYSPDKPYTVYSNDAWWGDDWDGTDYGQEFDFSRPFFEQFEELSLKVPLLSNVTLNSVNCEYTGFSVDSKNCYYSARNGHAEDTMYSYLTLKSTGIIDCYNTSHCNYCYECIDCWSCYECFYSQYCKNTNNSYFCYDCIGCSDCFGCVGLRNKKFYFFNQKCTQEEYREKVAQYNLGSYQVVQHLKKEVKKYLDARPKRAAIILNSENVTGNYITDAKNVHYSFDIEKVEDVRYSWGTEHAKDIFDCDYVYYGELSYGVVSNSGSTNVRFGFGIYGSNDIDYSMYIANNCSDLFGCISLKKKKYCILNKQYSKEEYFELKEKIIEHMKQTGEWGQYFPPSISTYAYNESVANQYFPMTKEEALARGYKWKDPEPREYQEPTAEVPDDIKDVSNDIIKEIFASKLSGRNYNITKEELKFYKLYNIPLPQTHFMERHAQRLQLRNPRKLWNQKCAKCSTDISTAFSPERPEIVYCEKCYLETVD